MATRVSCAPSARCASTRSSSWRAAASMPSTSLMAMTRSWPSRSWSASAWPIRPAAGNADAHAHALRRLRPLSGLALQRWRAACAPARPHARWCAPLRGTRPRKRSARGRCPRPAAGGTPGRKARRASAFRSRQAAQRCGVGCQVGPEHRTQALHGDARQCAPSCASSSCAQRFQLRVDAAVCELLQRGESRAHRHRVRAQRAGLVHRPCRRHQLHVLPLAAIGAHRESAADHLAVGDQVGLDADSGRRSPAIPMRNPLITSSKISSAPCLRHSLASSAAGIPAAAAAGRSWRAAAR